MSVIQLIYMPCFGLCSGHNKICFSFKTLGRLTNNKISCTTKTSRGTTGTTTVSAIIAVSAQMFYFLISPLWGSLFVVVLNTNITHTHRSLCLLFARKNSHESQVGVIQLPRPNLTTTTVHPLYYTILYIRP